MRVALPILIMAAAATAAAAEVPAKPHAPKAAKSTRTARPVRGGSSLAATGLSLPASAAVAASYGGILAFVARDTSAAPTASAGGATLTSGQPVSPE